MPLLDLFWFMLVLFIWVMWIWLLIRLFGDIFRRDDISGWGKTGWVILMLIIPVLGALIYLIAHGGEMAERDVKQMHAMEAAQKKYIQEAAGGGASTADELEKLAKLHQAGTLTAEEFAAQKAKLLA